MGQSIYIADDEKNIRELINSFLSNEGYTVTAFENGDDLLVEFLDNPCDMVILDIMMNGTDGLSVCSQIRQKHNVPIIIVSARDSELDRITGISIGSDDYLVKPFSTLELVARVKAIFRRMAFDREIKKTSTLKYGSIVLNLNTRDAFSDEKPLDLTPTEFAFMVYLFENSERAVSREELLKNVWKFDFEVDTRAIDDVLKRLRKKLLFSNVKIESVWGFGFKLSQEGNV
ncbi:MAG: response regulator transcription factor [Eubacteriales bacterium]|nr:response regulator transcription factor [Eubacteriales bacterium]